MVGPPLRKRVRITEDFEIFTHNLLERIRQMFSSLAALCATVFNQKCLFNTKEEAPWYMG
jgi:hypothetical protein